MSSSTGEANDDTTPKKVSPIRWFPRAKVESFLERKIRMLQEKDGVPLGSLDEALEDAPQKMGLVEREKKIAAEAAERAIQTRNVALVEASWYRILDAAGIPSQSAMDTAMEAERVASEAFAHASSLKVILDPSPYFPKLNPAGSASDSAGPSFKDVILESMEDARAIEKDVVFAVKNALKKAAKLRKDELESSPSIWRTKPTLHTQGTLVNNLEDSITNLQDIATTKEKDSDSYENKEIDVQTDSHLTSESTGVIISEITGSDSISNVIGVASTELPSNPVEVLEPVSTEDAAQSSTIWPSTDHEFSIPEVQMYLLNEPSIGISNELSVQSSENGLAESESVELQVENSALVSSECCTEPVVLISDNPSNSSTEPIANPQSNDLFKPPTKDSIEEFTVPLIESLTNSTSESPVESSVEPSAEHSVDTKTQESFQPVYSPASPKPYTDDIPEAFANPLTTPVSSPPLKHVSLEVSANPLITPVSFESLPDPAVQASCEFSAGQSSINPSIVFSEPVIDFDDKVTEVSNHLLIPSADPSITPHESVTAPVTPSIHPFVATGEEELADVMFSRIQAMDEHQIKSLEAIVATRGLMNGLLRELKDVRESGVRRVSGGGLGDVLVKHVSKLEAEKAAAAAASRDKVPNNRMKEGIKREDIPSSGLESFLKPKSAILEKESKKFESVKSLWNKNVDKDNRDLTSKSSKNADTHSGHGLSDILVKHVSKLEREKMLAKDKSSSSSISRTTKNIPSLANDFQGSSLGDVLSGKRASKLEKEEMNANNTEVLSMNSRITTTLKAEKISISASDTTRNSAKPTIVSSEDRDGNEGKENGVNSSSTRNIKASESRLRGPKKGEVTDNGGFGDLGSIMVKKKSKLEIEIEEAKKKNNMEGSVKNLKERSMVSRTTVPSSSFSSLSSFSSPSKSTSSTISTSVSLGVQLSKDSSAHVDGLNAMSTQSQPTRKVLKKKDDVDSIWKGQGLGETMKKHVSKLERDKAAWKLAEEKARNKL